MATAAGELWVFAYGSLMWHPGFVPAEVRPARLDGFHRALCVLSFHYRGSPERPGLVLGLDRGGTCRGLAYRVATDDRDAVLAYLRARELIYGVYREQTLPVRLEDSGETVPALGYVAERAHPSYAGRLPATTAAAMVRSAHGAMGSNLAYLARTLEHFSELGIAEPDLRRLHVLAGAFATRAAAGEARARAITRAWARHPHRGPDGPADPRRQRFPWRTPRSL